MDIQIDVHGLIEEDWLKDEYTKLFLGIDHSGHYVHPNRAITLECWQCLPDQIRPCGPAFKEAPEALVRAILRKGGKFYSLYTNVQRKTNAEVLDWLTTLHRYPEGDLNQVTATALESA
jgi:hypothetical protein